MPLVKKANGDNAPAENLTVAGIELSGEDLASLTTLLNPDGSLQAKTKTVVLLAEQARGRIATTVEGNTALAEYRVTLTIERDPVSDRERAAVAAREEAGKTAKQHKLDKETRNKALLVEQAKREAVAGVEAGISIGERLRREAEAARRALETYANGAAR